ncbi:MAG: hypothetical protein R2696_16890 [Microthrixaceae bacterium]
MKHSSARSSINATSGGRPFRAQTRSKKTISSTPRISYTRIA